jgi:predicted lipoprotein with Yx(FWY)xxD motif
MVSRTKIRFYASTVLGVGLALVLAACGSSSSSNSSKSAASSTPSSTNAAATSVMVKTANSSAGKYLVGPNGKALYLFMADKNGKSACSGACAKVWPPLTTTGKPGVSGGAVAADLGTITRSDGTKQVTYKGHPLYYYVSDTSPGQTTGQGSNNFGAKWWLVAPSGAAITKSVSGGSSSSSSSSGGGYSGGSSTSSSGGSSSGGGWG